MLCAILEAIASALSFGTIGYYAIAIGFQIAPVFILLFFMKCTNKLNISNHQFSEQNDDDS